MNARDLRFGVTWTRTILFVILVSFTGCRNTADYDDRDSPASAGGCCRGAMPDHVGFVRSEKNGFTAAIANDQSRMEPEESNVKRNGDGFGR